MVLAQVLSDRQVSCHPGLQVSEAPLGLKNQLPKSLTWLLAGTHHVGPSTGCVSVSIA